jgi:hypothetical protein
MAAILMMAHVLGTAFLHQQRLERGANVRRHGTRGCEKKKNKKEKKASERKREREGREQIKINNKMHLTNHFITPR